MLIFHEEMLSSLQKSAEEALHHPAASQSTVTRVGKTFKRFSGHLRLYVDYVQNLNDIMPLLVAELEKNPKFQKFCADRSPPGLDSLIIKPVQKIPQYGLLLERLLENTFIDHPDAQDTEKALRKVKEAGKYCEKCLDDTENAREVKSIYDLFSTKSKRSLQSTEGVYRNLVRGGRVTKIDRNNKKTLRHLYLFNDILVVSKVRKLNGKLSISRHLPLRKVICSTRSLARAPADFKVTFDDAVVHLRAKNRKQAEEWLRAIQEQKQNLSSDVGIKVFLSANTDDLIGEASTPLKRFLRTRDKSGGAKSPFEPSPAVTGALQRSRSRKLSSQLSLVADFFSFNSPPQRCSTTGGMTKSYSPSSHVRPRVFTDVDPCKCYNRLWQTTEQEFAPHVAAEEPRWGREQETLGGDRAWRLFASSFEGPAT